MITNPSAENKPQDQSAATIEPGFEEAIHAFWIKNRSLIFAVCIAALLAVIVREGWQYYAASQEQGVRSDYAKAADRPELLAAFATAHAGHSLAGVAYLRIADAKYVSADFRSAGESYAKAAANLMNPTLLGRAKMGAAMCQFNGGDKTAGEAALNAIMADSNMVQSIRAEGAYHLATIAFEAGNAAEVSRLVAEIGKIDATGEWSQRATALLTVKPSEARDGS